VFELFDGDGYVEPDLNFVIDVRYIEIESELHAVEQNRSALESQLPIIQQNERARILDELREQYEPDEADARFDHEVWVDVFIEYELPQLVRYPILVSLWAVYESATAYIGEELQKGLNRRLSLDDIRGGVLERTKKYFDDVLEFPLTASDNEMLWIRRLAILRNAVAHGNGRKQAVKPTIWRTIESWNQPGIDTDLPFLFFSADFVSEMARVVSKSLFNLIERAKAI